MRNLIETVAWVLLERGKILCVRSHGKDAFYIPGGKREPGESELDTLVREAKEELAVDLLPETALHVGSYRARAHAQPPGVDVLMSCYTAGYRGVPAASSEIAELAWLRYADRDRVAYVDQVLFDDLRARGDLR